MILQKMVRFFIASIAGAGGFGLAYWLIELFGGTMPKEVIWTAWGLGAIVAMLLGWGIAPAIMGGVSSLLEWLEERLHKTPIQDMFSGIVGLVVGLIVANLLGFPFGRLPLVGPYIPIAFSLVLAYLGFNVGVKRREEIISLPGVLVRARGGRVDKAGRINEPVNLDDAAALKVLDTSVIIDGRIADICQSGFLEGTMVVPSFVLEELRHIADSPDLLKRNRGRRGLDILNKMQKEQKVKVQVYEVDYDDLAEVDSKLVRLGQELGARVLTNDYNLNKVAELQGVGVLNINDLANAVKPVVLPGEEMQVQVIKDGKEAGQGIGYLDDGTMIVVENGRRYMNQTVPVLVTSVLQTAAGRMIFAKPKLIDRRAISRPLERGEFSV